MNLPAYLWTIVAGPTEYSITGGVHQVSVLGSLLWNIMCDGLLKLVLPEDVKLVAYVDKVALVLVAKYLPRRIRSHLRNHFRKNRQVDEISQSGIGRTQNGVGAHH